MAHLMQVHKSITTLQGEDIVFLATDINLPGTDQLGFVYAQLPWPFTETPVTVLFRCC